MKLFWKLFTILGIAMTVAMVAAVTMGWNIGQTTIRQAFDFDPEAREPIINRVSQALNRGGRSELTAWLRQNQTPVPGRMLFIFDDEGQDLLGRDVPRGFDFILSPQFRRLGDRRFGDNAAGRNRFNLQLTDLVYDTEGYGYRLLFVRTDVTLLNILGLPSTQLGIVTLAIIMAAGTALLLAKSFSSPIVRLQRATRSLAAGLLETRVGQPFNKRKDEIGTLARDFDTMAERIQALITDKEVLLRDVSHELRSPLARIRVALALAQRKADEKAEADLLRIEQETERLDQLVGQILTLARLRSSSVEDFDDVDINAIVSEVIADARFEQPENHISLDADPVGTIAGNAGELSSAIENVLRNALLHTGESTDVVVRVKREAQDIVVTIEDNGPGVPEAELKHLFDPFYRADPSRDHKQSGYGLGLAIAARIIERHGGSVAAKNRSGGGLAVSFRLPAGR